MTKVTSDDDLGFEIRTQRAAGSLRRVLEAGDSRAQEFAALVVSDLDAGEGWIHHDHGIWWWYPGQLGVQVRYSDPGITEAHVEARIRVVRGAGLTEQLIDWLTDLNAHSLGWWWWYEEASGDVYCSMKCTTEVKSWWWPFVMSQVLPHAATVAESMATVLADAGQGHVAVESHPSRGARGIADGFIDATRLGPRDMSASLDPWIADSELARLEQALTAIAGKRPAQVHTPLVVVLASDDAQPQIMLRRHWHASWGWGWQIITLTGIKAAVSEPTLDGELFALFLNQEQATSTRPANYFGGWVYDQEAGLLHLTFLPGLLIDILTASAGPTIGDVAALMMDVPMRLAALEALPINELPASLSLQPISEEFVNLLGTLGLRRGVLGWSYELGESPPVTGTHQAATEELWSADCPDVAWNIPKHVPVCGFGVFNPMGPTVSSLEIGMSWNPTGIELSLFHVMRHPHSPEIRLLGTVAKWEEMDSLIFTALVERDPETRILGSGPEWLEIWGHQDTILAALRAFAEADVETNWRARADDLANYALSPWARVSPREERSDSIFDEDGDPIDCWLEAITSYSVVVGQKLFMRSAWEGALRYRQSNWDADVAQSAANSARATAQERLDAEFGSRN